MCCPVLSNTNRVSCAYKSLGTGTFAAEWDLDGEPCSSSSDPTSLSLWLRWTQLKKNEWGYKSFLSGKHFILARRLLETAISYPSTAPDEMRVCWSWNKTTVTLCWLSCKKDKALTGQPPLSGTATLSWERVSSWRYSQHWEPCHGRCPASSLFWWRGWSLPCCEHRWSVSPVCRNHLGGGHERDRKCKLNV